MSAMLPCLILAGGLGTRLRPVLGEAMPKALASIDGEPFLSWMLRWLSQQGVTDVVRGRDLLPVWQGFRTRRLRLLRVKSETDGVTLDHGAPHIDSITVTPLRARK